MLTLFLCGDVMTGRGIDQILRHPTMPDIYEPYVWSLETRSSGVPPACAATPNRPGVDFLDDFSAALGNGNLALRWGQAVLQH